jgi:hypothetical protein
MAMIDAFHKQQDHRSYLEKTVVDGDMERARSGLTAGLVVSLSFLFVSAGLVYTGHDTAGTIIGTIDLVALTGVFVFGSLIRRNERLEKMALLTGKTPPQEKEKAIEPKGK